MLIATAACVCGARRAPVVFNGAARLPLAPEVLGAELFTQSENCISVRLFQSVTERRGRIVERHVLSHSCIKLFDNNKLALHGVVQNQNNKLRCAQNVRLNKLDKLDHSVIINVAPHIAQAVKAESRRDG